jgi:hypothetical protein
MAGHAHHTAGRRHGLGLAVQLVPEALDVVHSIGDDDVVARQHALHGRIFLGTRILLSPRSVVDGARHAQRLVVDEVHLQSAGAGIGARGSNLGLAVRFELQCACGLPRGRVS